MSYRTFKHLLGETSLERKCRFIFSLGILILVTLSFWWYGHKTESLVIGQKVDEARVRVEQTVTNMHIKKEVGPGLESLVNELSGDQAPLNREPRYVSHILRPYALPDEEHDAAKSKRANDEYARDIESFERDKLARFMNAALKGGTPKKAYSFGDGTPMEFSRIMTGRRQYQYIQAVLFEPRCLVACHEGFSAVEREGRGQWTKPRVGDLACAVGVTLPMDDTNRAIHRNRAVLISAALLTALLAMLASYVIVRYVIVKPVKHLRDVSEAVAAGKLTIRSQIQTGDEFEELSHAFNRMLHNLLAMQQELREVNGDLDRKVDELAQANLALFEMNRLKSDFLATMSHELRTPLNSIIGFSEVLASSDQINERQKRYAANIQSSGKMLLGMINDILDLAKIESGKMEIRTEDFSIRDVCEGLANLARPVAERKNIDLECRLDEAIPLLRQDPGKLRQIIYNLLSNAIKFTPEGGRVTLRARGDGRFVVIEVADTGIGIAEEDRDKIFEKFRQGVQPGQGDGVLTREHQGTGLGLSIVRELTKLLGGDIRLDSRPGQGSTFTVRLPQQLPGNRKFEVNLSDERIDLSKARRVEPRSLPTSPLVTLDVPPESRRWSGAEPLRAASASPAGPHSAASAGEPRGVDAAGRGP